MLISPTPHMDEVRLFAVLIEILKERMPEDCGELLDDNYKLLLKEIKRKGLDAVLREWLGEEGEVILVERS